ncbi:ANTAR domain-containing protein [Streptomyces coelicoflavus]|uniref:ANTAR domain-containing protein n=1 Tax=Streptomyces coelicoflavus TaxID=285562 RepID=UPI003635A4A6
MPRTDVRPNPGPSTGPDPGQDSDSDQIFRLQEQVRQLKEAVVSHAVVDQAIGVIIVLGGVTPDEGWIVLKEVSQHTNIKLRNVAETVLIWGRTGVMPQEILTALEDRLGRPVCGGAGLSAPPPGSPRVSGRNSR